MPILPLVDALLLTGWSSLMVAFVMKAISISTAYQPAILGLSARDFLLFAALCMVFALTLVARTWVKLNEPRLLRRREFGPYVGAPLGRNGDGAFAEHEEAARSGSAS